MMCLQSAMELLFVRRSNRSAGVDQHKYMWLLACSLERCLHELPCAWVQVKAQEVQASCPLPFDEWQLWRGDDADELRTQLQGSFRNITAVMDCVGCEKCKLWGKLQLLGELEASGNILHPHHTCMLDAAHVQQHWQQPQYMRVTSVCCPGIATSLKILFTPDECVLPTPVQQPQLQLERNEVIALMNLLERLSNSIEIVRVMSSEHQQPGTASAHGRVVQRRDSEALEQHFPPHTVQVN